MESMGIDRLSESMEELINQIPDVISSKVILNENKEVEEIHVLASNNRSPKQVSRDIQSALAAKFVAKIDYKKISVAQINFKHEEQVQDLERLKINAIGYAVVGNMAEIKVVLDRGEETIEKTVRGVNSRNNVYRLVAQATLECIHALLGLDHGFILEDIEKINLAKRDVMTAAINYISEQNEELLVGSAIVKKDEYETVVRATLDAINRKIMKCCG